MPTIDIEVVDYGPKELDEVISSGFIDSVTTQAEEHLKTDGHLDTTIFIYTANKHLLQLMPDLNDIAGTLTVFSAIEGMYPDCLAFCMVNDGYVIFREEGDSLGLERDVALDEEGDECVIVQLRVRDGRFWVRQRIYHRHMDEIILDDTRAEGSHSDRQSELYGSILDPWRESGPAPVR